MADPRRGELYGSNRTVERKGVTYCELVWEGMHDLTLILLSIAAVISIFLGVRTEGWGEGWYDGAAIIIAVVVFLIMRTTRTAKAVGGVKGKSTKSAKKAAPKKTSTKAVKV